MRYRMLLVLIIITSCLQASNDFFYEVASINQAASIIKPYIAKSLILIATGNYISEFALANR